MLRRDALTHRRVDGPMCRCVLLRFQSNVRTARFSLVVQRWDATASDGLVSALLAPLANRSAWLCHVAIQPVTGWSQRGSATLANRSPSNIVVPWWDATVYDGLVSPRFNYVPHFHITFTAQCMFTEMFYILLRLYENLLGFSENLLFNWKFIFICEIVFLATILDCTCSDHILNDVLL